MLCGCSVLGYEEILNREGLPDHSRGKDVGKGQNCGSGIGDWIPRQHIPRNSERYADPSNTISGTSVNIVVVAIIWVHGSLWCGIPVCYRCLCIITSVKSFQRTRLVRMEDAGRVPVLPLEMIRDGPSTLSGGWNEVLASRLMGTDSAERTLRNVRIREKLEVR